MIWGRSGVGKDRFGIALGRASVGFVSMLGRLGVESASLWGRFRGVIQDSRGGDAASQDHPELVTKYEGLLENWCRQIEQYLEETLENQQKDNGDNGPRTELDFWRTRLQKITSITEQLRSKDRKMVFGLLQAITRVSQDVAPKSRLGRRYWGQSCLCSDGELTMASAYAMASA